MNTMRGLSTLLAGLIFGATVLCATGCAADAEPEPEPAPVQQTDSLPVPAGTPDTNGVPQAPPSTQTTGATSTTPSGAPLAPAQPRITPKK
jgi:hypothetical protein